MTEPTIATALTALGFIGGYAANDHLGIILWTRDEPQPTVDELVAAGWIPLAPDDGAQPSTDVG